MPQKNYIEIRKSIIQSFNFVLKIYIINMNQVAAKPNTIAEEIDFFDTSA